MMRMYAEYRPRSSLRDDTGDAVLEEERRDVEVVRSVDAGEVGEEGKAFKINVELGGAIDPVIDCFLEVVVVSPEKKLFQRHWALIFRLGRRVVLSILLTKAFFFFLGPGG